MDRGAWWAKSIGRQRVRHNWSNLSHRHRLQHAGSSFFTISWNFFKFMFIASVKAMAPHSSTLAWKIPWTEEPGKLQSMRSLRVGHDWATSLSLSCIGEGHGNPLQCSCLENPRDRGAWWEAVYGVTQSRTRLKWLSSSSSILSNHLILCHPLPFCLQSFPASGTFSKNQLFL